MWLGLKPSKTTGNIGKYKEHPAKQSYIFKSELHSLYVLSNCLTYTQIFANTSKSGVHCYITFCKVSFNFPYRQIDHMIIGKETMD